MIATKIKTQLKVLKAVLTQFIDDSDDRISLAETLFSETSALFGTNIFLFFNHPTKIRAPEERQYVCFESQVYITNYPLNLLE